MQNVVARSNCVETWNSFADGFLGVLFRSVEEGEFAVHDIRKGGRLKVEGGFFRKNWKMF